MTTVSVARPSSGCETGAVFVYQLPAEIEMSHEDKHSTDLATSVPTCTAALMSLVPPGARSGAWAAGSDAPEKKEVRIGFIPLTDCSRWSWRR
jgi:hypothetical protein